MTDQLNLLKTAPQITAMELRKNLGEILGEAHYNGKAHVITQNGKPMAAIVSLEDYLKVLALKETAD